MDESVLLSALSHGSASRRASGLEVLCGLGSSAFQSLVLRLLGSEYRDVREGLLALCSVETLKEPGFREHLVAWVGDEEVDPLVRQGLLVLISRLEGTLEDALTAYYRRCFDDADADVRYQAFWVAELRNEEGEDYLARVRAGTSSKDEDLRILASQAICRLRPSWAEEVLTEQARYALGVEAFHVLLARLSLGDAALRLSLEPSLVAYLNDERFVYPAVLALRDYGSEACIEGLLRVAGSFLAEPTVRVAAAEAAARHGSEKGRSLLVAFSNKRSGNPSYAAEALLALDGG
ncbi:MAG: hypothetical protein FWC40_03375 [Proteobacteria bacterium]|nr:hypothetical protein [Pseudomonadota bacterium]